MKLEEFDSFDWYDTEEIPPSVSVSELKDQSERTLLYGYTVERDTWEVKLSEGQLKLSVWAYKEEPVVETHARWEDAHRLIPSKRLYPERCDFEFCKLLHSKGILLPFTTYRDR